MNMNKAGMVFVGVAASVALMIGSLIGLSGCETGGDTVALNVEPAFVDLTGVNSNSVMTQTFTATGGLRELSLPLEWSVSDPSLGSIASYGGTTASYVRSAAHGDNSIRVKDQYGAEGVATVRQ